MIEVAASLAMLVVAVFISGYMMLAMMSAWGVLDPRMSQQVKGGLMRLILAMSMLSIISLVASAVMSNVSLPAIDWVALWVISHPVLMVALIGAALSVAYNHWRTHRYAYGDAWTRLCLTYSRAYGDAWARLRAAYWPDAYQRELRQRFTEEEQFNILRNTWLVEREAEAADWDTRFAQATGRTVDLDRYHAKGERADLCDSSTMERQASEHRCDWCPTRDEIIARRELEARYRATASKIAYRDPKARFRVR